MCVRKMIVDCSYDSNIKQFFGNFISLTSYRQQSYLESVYENGDFDNDVTKIDGQACPQVGR